MTDHRNSSLKLKCKDIEERLQDIKEGDTFTFDEIVNKHGAMI